VSRSNLSKRSETSETTDNQTLCGPYFSGFSYSVFFCGGKFMNRRRLFTFVLFVVLLAWNGSSFRGVTGVAFGAAGATTPPFPAELEIVLSAPGLIFSGRDIDYVFTVSNLGGETAVDVVASMALPAATEWVSGGEVDIEGIVTLPVGDLDGGESRSVVLSVRPIPPEDIPTAVVRGRRATTADDLRPLKSAGPQIIGGREAEPGAWPWQVALLTSAVEDGYYAQFCGGSLIAPNWVLTAAHCVSNPYTGVIVSPSTIDVAVGRHVLSSDEGQRIATLQIVRHPDYDSGSTDSDVALLRLAEAAVYTMTVAPITPLSPTLASLAAPAVEAMVIGWGARNASGGDYDYADALHQVSVPIIEQAVCRADYDPVLGLGSITDNMICAGLEEGERDSCFGDSGGPLMVPDGEDGWLQAGIVSWGIGCAQPGYPGVYTRVTQFYDWVEEWGRNTYTTPGTYTAVAANDVFAVGFDQLQTMVIRFDPCDESACEPRQFFLPVVQQASPEE
jgi:secreted trypsin-like serine protease